MSITSRSYIVRIFLLFMGVIAYLLLNLPSKGWAQTLPQMEHFNPKPINRTVSAPAAVVESDPDDSLEMHDDRWRQMKQIRDGSKEKSASFRQNKRARDEKLSSSDAQVKFRKMNRTPIQIRGNSLEPASGDGSNASEQALLTARNFLRKHRGLLRIHEPDSELTMVRDRTDSLNRRHLRFAQNYKGIPVYPAELIVHLNPNGDVDLMNGSFVPTPRKMNTKPVVTAENAMTIARKEIPDGDQAVISDPELVIYSPTGSAPRLSWKMNLNISLTSQWIAVVDALNGKTLTAYNTVKTEGVTGGGTDLFGGYQPLTVWRQGNAYYMVDTSKAMYNQSSRPPNPETTRGAIIVLDAENQPPTSNVNSIPNVDYVSSNSPDSGWLPDAVSAARNLSLTYDYFLQNHNRNSIDGKGGSIHAIVRIGRGYSNAAWVDELNMMIFGDEAPYGGALDVVAHELTHGVTSNEANLIYQYQSGAMNEAFSDIFGEMVEAKATGSTDWEMGTSLPKPSRSLEAPNSINIQSGLPYPAKMTQYIKTSSDNGGVHLNSTIIGHAFYLLAEGLPGAIGNRDAEQIFYRSLTYHLVSNSQFVDCRLACITSAEELFGKGSNQASKTAQAFDAVEIYDGEPTQGTAPKTPTQTGDSALFVYYDPDQNGYFLGRRESGDPANGVQLSGYEVSRSRASVSGDGLFAVYVDIYNDPCFIETDGNSDEECMGWYDTESVAMSQDGKLFGFVFQGEDGNADNKLAVFDLHEQPVAGTVREFELVSPSIDGASIQTIIRADAMSFTSDNKYIFYDALNEIELTDGSKIGAWSIYAIDLETEQTLVIMPPIHGYDIGFPAISHTTDTYLTFDAFNTDTENSTVFALNLISGDMKPVATVSGDWGTPSYTGDDRGIIYSNSDSSATGFSLYRQELASDHLTISGSPQLFLENADFSTIYRVSRASSSGTSSGGGSSGGCFIEDTVTGVDAIHFIGLILFMFSLIGVHLCIKKSNHKPK